MDLTVYRHQDPQTRDVNALAARFSALQRGTPKWTLKHPSAVLPCSGAVAALSGLQGIDSQLEHPSPRSCLKLGRRAGGGEQQPKVKRGGVPAQSALRSCGSQQL